MSALVGLLVSYAVLIGNAPPATAGCATGTDDVCAPAGRAACEPAALPTADATEPVEYASPAEVDCPGPTALERSRDRGAANALELPLRFEDCSLPALDFRYRVSRSPESERPTGALRPQKSRRTAHPEAACTGLPPEHATPLAASRLPPIAVYAVLTLPPPGARATVVERSSRPSLRALEPLDRPPRA